MQRAGFATKIAFLCGGLLIWAVHFLTVYAVNGLACARGLAGTRVPTVVAVVTALAVLAAAAIVVAAVLGRGPGIRNEPAPSVRGFWRLGTGLLAGFGVVAVLWTGLPALMVPPCG